MSRHVDMSTTYLGLHLPSPIVASAGPLTGDQRCWSALETAGVGAIVLPSLFEEQIEREAFAMEAAMSLGAHVSAESSGYLPEVADVDTTSAWYLAMVELARDSLSVPVIASLNGTSSGGWVHYARALENAGAHAIELNIFEVPADADASARAIEARHVELLQTVKSVVTIPVAVKLVPWLTAPAELGMRLIEAGADGLVLFNRFMQPDVDIARMTMVAQPQLSSPWEARMPMTWIAVLRGRTQASLAATTGVAGTADVVKFLLAGADVVMTASALLRNGPAFAATMLGGLRDWMVGAGEASVAELRGRLHRELGESSVEKRAGYIAFRAEGAREYG